MHFDYPLFLIITALCRRKEFIYDITLHASYYKFHALRFFVTPIFRMKYSPFNRRNYAIKQGEDFYSKNVVKSLTVGSYDTCSCSYFFCREIYICFLDLFLIEKYVCSISIFNLLMQNTHYLQRMKLNIYKKIYCFIIFKS